MFALVCEIHGADPEPTAFRLQEVKNEISDAARESEASSAAALAVVDDKIDYVPIPLPAPRDTPRVNRKGAPAKTRTDVEEVAFAASPTTELISPFEILVDKARAKIPANPKALYVKADGNEEMGCIERNRFLMGVLRDVKSRYRSVPIVDSGYRSPAHNRAVSGAKNSLHMRCLALDIKVPGVNKDALASYLRSYPRMGGVGLYASNFVHFDAGPRRDWDWRKPRHREHLKSPVVKEKHKWQHHKHAQTKYGRPRRRR
jgi:hypothetical protein